MDAPTDASAGPDQVDRGHVDAMMQQVNPNDVNAVLQFAIGPLDCAASLVSQQPGSLPEVHAIYFADVHTYVIKKAGIGGKDDWRCYDAATGKMVFNSHHPGKDPYAQLDPLGLNSGPPPAGPNGGGEWEAVCDVSGHNGGFKIRPKKLSMHGRQFIKLRDVPVLSVGKVSKLKAMSLGKTFSVAVEGLRSDPGRPSWTPPPPTSALPDPAPQPPLPDPAPPTPPPGPGPTPPPGPPPLGPPPHLPSRTPPNPPSWTPAWTPPPTPPPGPPPIRPPGPPPPSALPDPPPSALPDPPNPPLLDPPGPPPPPTSK